MKRSRSILIAGLTPILVGVSPVEAFDCVFYAEDYEEPLPRDPRAERDALDEYLYEIEGVIEGQLDEIGRLDASRDMADLRASHYGWKLARDLLCARLGREEPSDLAELECLARMSEEYYQERELEIVRLETDRAARGGASIAGAP